MTAHREGHIGEAQFCSQQQAHQQIQCGAAASSISTKRRRLAQPGSAAAADAKVQPTKQAPLLLTRVAVHVVHGDVKVSHALPAVQVHGQHAVGTRLRDDVGAQLGGNRLAALQGEKGSGGCERG